MDSLKLKQFITEHQKLAADGYKFFFVIEFFFLKEIKDNYVAKFERLSKISSTDKDEKLRTPIKVGNFLKHGYNRKNFDDELTGIKVIHYATREGFAKGDIIFIGEESTKLSDKEKADKFLDAFNKIVSSKDNIPDKSCIILSSDKHHLTPIAGESVSTKMKTREQLSQRKGQKAMTDFFQTTKSATPYNKKPAPLLKYNIEEITRKIRGDEVKILWMPKSNLELDPSQFVSIVLLADISTRIDIAEDEPDIKEISLKAINEMDNLTWEAAAQYQDDIVALYVKDPPKTKVKSENIEAGIKDQPLT